MSYTDAAQVVLANYSQPDTCTVALIAFIPLALLGIVVLILGTVARLAQMFIDTVIEETDR